MIPGEHNLFSVGGRLQQFSFTFRVVSMDSVQRTHAFRIANAELSRQSDALRSKRHCYASQREILDSLCKAVQEDCAQLHTTVSERLLHCCLRDRVLNPRHLS